MNVLKLVDVADIGIEKEKARRDFYDQVASHFDDPEMKDLFTRLRDWEKAHITRFGKIRDELNEPQTAESYPGELTAYVNALVDDTLYSEVTPESFAAHIKRPVDAINYGIGFEKDAILLFMELSQYVQRENKAIIEKLIDEERQHVIYLIQMKKKLIHKS